MFKMLKRISKKNKEENIDRLLSLCNEGDYGICPPPMDANVAVKELAEFFLGPNWYISSPIGWEQSITEIVLEIESRYSFLGKN